MLTREEWTRGPGNPPVVKGLIWWGWGLWQSLGRRLSILLRNHAAVFQAEVYAIVACVYEIGTQGRPEKYVSICCDSQVALKAFHAVKTTSPLVQQCQKALNDISPWHTVGLYWVPGHARVRGNEMADKLARGDSTQKFIGPEPSLEVSRQNINNKI